MQINKSILAPDSSNVRGVYTLAMSNMTANPLVGDTFTAAPSSATGKVASWVAGLGQLFVHLDSSVAVAAGDTLTFAGGIGTVNSLLTSPDFIDAGVVPNSLITINGITYTISGVPSKHLLTITGAIPGTDQNLILLGPITVDFTPFRSFPLGNESTLPALAARLNRIVTMLDGLV